MLLGSQVCDPGAPLLHLGAQFLGSPANNRPLLARKAQHPGDWNYWLCR